MTLQKDHLGRRRLLLLGGAAGAAGCGAGSNTAADARVATDADQPYIRLDGGLDYATADGWSPGVVGVEVGLVSELPEGVWRYNGGARAIVTRDAGGYLAYSALCTHEGCLVAPPDDEGATTCPCHGSAFDGMGHPTLGPATSALPRHAVRVLDGRVFVDPSSRVSAGARANPDGSGDGGVDYDAGSIDSAVDPCSTGFDVGALSLYAPNTWTRLSALSLIVGRDARGLFAYSARCTHQNCLVEPPAAATGVARCNCHGSTFDGSGHVTAGPARADLDHYAVYLCAGNVRVDAETVVDPAARTAVP